MAKKTDTYVVGVITSTKTEATIRFVTRCESGFAMWDAGKKAKTFSKLRAEDIAKGLCMNGTLAVPILVANYISLKNPDVAGEGAKISN